MPEKKKKNRVVFLHKEEADRPCVLQWSVWVSSQTGGRDWALMRDDVDARQSAAESSREDQAAQCSLAATAPTTTWPHHLLVNERKKAINETACADFPTGIARHPGRTRNGIVCCCLLRTAYRARLTTHCQWGLGDDSAVFHFLSPFRLWYSHICAEKGR